METYLSKLVESIARRNGSFSYYALRTFTDESSSEEFLTCENELFPETSSTWLFSDVSEDEAVLLLHGFVLGTIPCTYEVQRHLARLLAIKGRLVEDIMGPVIGKTDWTSYASPNLLLAYLASSPEGDDEILRMLDLVPEGGRDGILTACWFSESQIVNARLVEKFEEWTHLPACDEESYWLEQFLGKWISHQIFPLQRLEELMIWYFKKKLT